MVRPTRTICALVALIAAAPLVNGTERGPVRADTTANMRATVAADLVAGLLERVDALELNTDQRRRVREIQLDMKRTTIPLQASARVKLHEIEELLLGESVNEDEVDSKLIDINRVKQEADRAAISAFLAVRQVLTTEQLAQLLAPPAPSEPETLPTRTEPTREGPEDRRAGGKRDQRRDSDGRGEPKGR